MSKKNIVSSAILSIALLLAVGCATDQLDPTPTAIEAVILPAPTWTLVPTVAPEARPTYDASIAGRYRLRPPNYEEDYDQSIEADYYLVLNDDSTVHYEEQKIGTSEVSVIARGTWKIDGDGVIVELTELFGEPVANPEVLKYENVDGFPVVTAYEAGGTLFNLEDAEFSIGAGERHPLMRELHQRLARIPYLNFTDPGPEGDIYNETTRKAVVAFQEAQGLLPNGVVDADTWVLLGNPPPPLPTPTPIPLPTPAVPTATTSDIVNLRGGPGTQFDVLGTLPQGASVAITGRNVEGTWIQVSYPDAESRAWISAEFATISGDLSAASVVEVAPPAEEPTPDTATVPPTAEATPATEAPPPSVAETPRTGAPKLENLPTHTDDGKPIVYLTFDDGPTQFTPQMVNLMDQYDAQATFFVLGNLVQRNPEIVREATIDGHYIANHTYNHPSLAGFTPEQFMNEVETTRQAILEVAGDLFNLDKDVKYLRPPYGATDANTRNYAASLGYAVVLWDIDPQDWRRPGADVISSHIISSVYPGAIVLMHDGGGDRSQSVAALETVLRELSAQGYAFRNVFVAP